MNETSREIWGHNAPGQALSQVADICRRELGLAMKPVSDGSGFVAERAEDAGPGVIRLKVYLAADGEIGLKACLMEGSSQAMFPAGDFFEAASRLEPELRLISPEKADPDGTAYGAELRIRARPLGLSQSTTLAARLKGLQDLAVKIQKGQPRGNLLKENLAQAYKPFEKLLRPSPAWDGAWGAPGPDIEDWADWILSLLRASVPCALACPDQATGEACQAILADAALKKKTSLAIMLPQAVKTGVILEAAARAPGLLTAPAAQLGLGINPYEMAQEVQSLLDGLSALGRAVLFTGSLEQLQNVFHGGQGARLDPLKPLVAHAPDFPLPLLAAHQISLAMERAGGAPASTLGRLKDELLKGLGDLAPGERKRLMPFLAQRLAGTFMTGKTGAHAKTKDFARRLGLADETLGGLGMQPRAKRSSRVHQGLVKGLSDPELYTYFQEHLAGQGRALKELCARLSTEGLTRPRHQPVRYCAQGTPGTGKSESAVLLAARLGIPYVNIDAASFADHHTATSQLLGAGRGIVSSHRPGRLEEVARHHKGAVVEISDLDHAPAHVRGPLADLFMQVLETGSAQSSTGAAFSCANLVLAFTMNLPGGADERVRKGLGFASEPDHKEVQGRVLDEIKQMLSGAFLSRVGSPILFDPLSRKTLGLILERAMKKAVRSAAVNLDLGEPEIKLAPGLGLEVLCGLARGQELLGARAVLEKGRSLAAAAFLDRDANIEKADSLMLRLKDDGTLEINNL